VVDDVFELDQIRELQIRRSRREQL